MATKNNNEINAMRNIGAINSGLGNQYLVFGLDKELYGIDILLVETILSYTTPSSIPNAPKYLKGVINLRNMIIPIIDMRLRFGLEEKEYNDYTVVVVVNINKKQYGLVVDTVQDVIAFGEDSIQRDVNLGSGIDQKYITGIGKEGDRMIVLVDVEKMFKKEELEAMNRAI